MAFVRNLNYSCLSILFVLLLDDHLVHCHRPFLTLYEENVEEPNRSNSFTFHGSMPDLTGYPFENVTKICGYGIWQLYGEVGYESYQTHLQMGYSLGEETCESSLPLQSCKSFKLPVDMDTRKSTLTLFTLPNYEGTVITLNSYNYEFALADVPQFRSYIVTNNQPWAFFSEPNFGNQSSYQGTVQGYYDGDYSQNSDFNPDPSIRSVVFRGSV